MTDKDWALNEAIALSKARFRSQAVRRKWFKRVKAYLERLLQAYGCDPGAWLTVFMGNFPVLPENSDPERYLQEFQSDLEYCSDRLNPQRVVRLCAKFGRYLQCVDHEWWSKNIDWNYNNAALYDLDESGRRY